MANKPESKISFQTRWTADGVQLTGYVPARLSRTETALLMGFHPDGMTPLANKKLLSPMGTIGKRKHFKSTYYCTVEVIKFMNDADKMSQAQFAITQYNNDNKARSKAKLG